ncbi:LexA family transcriptional regulator [Paenibacillus sp. MER 78]|uniref:LexA family protein n=1 Tax=Paenibacillus sp. MER 78 TaxID=2939571 RepID=UPI00203B81B6|nr:LexA family transcriptional regulator [Paenibacillus sp. MER 78]MCM3130934.1 helix-turn-helix domain-containing protein [Paenibacillus sp. MER 78]
MSFFSERLKILREKAGLTQKEVAIVLGMTQSSYSKYEYGTREPNIDNILKLAKLFNVSSDYLLGNEEAKPSELVTIPLLIKVSGGDFIYDPEGSLPFPKDFINDRDAFLFQVKDDSMLQYDIDENDFVIVEKSSEANNHDIILCIFQNELIIRQIAFVENTVILFSSRTKNPVSCRKDDIQIVGKVIGVFKTFD